MATNEERRDEADRQRWVDDGGGPRANPGGPRRAAPQTSWGTIGAALAVGFAVGWLMGE